MYGMCPFLDPLSDLSDDGYLTQCYTFPTGWTHSCAIPSNRVVQLVISRIVAFRGQIIDIVIRYSDDEKSIHPSMRFRATSSCKAALTRPVSQDICTARIISLSI